MTQTILVTGANGFVGQPLCALLQANGFKVRAAVRAGKSAPPGTESVVIGDIGPETDWTQAVQGVDAVVHLAARVHQMQDSAADPLPLYRAVNCEGAVRLAAQAQAAGVKRFIYISSITVQGEGSGFKRAYAASDAPNPQTPYATSKIEAEQALEILAQLTGLGLTILRPPLVIGPGAKGNLDVLIGMIKRGIPMPIGLIKNRRSLLGVDNLAAAIAFCLNQPSTIGGTYLLKDADDVSVPDLVRRMAQLLGKPALILPVPVWLLTLGGALLGRSPIIRRITGSLWVDDAPLRALGWQPPHSFEQSLAAMLAINTYTHQSG